jgi:Ca2+/H+ antiporter, TMEM165/GDT1 family
MGDKTQLLSLVLSARYRKPYPIVFGIFIATLVNHTFSGAVGTWFASVISERFLNWAIVASFAVMAFWILIPDKLEDSEATSTKHVSGIFTTTVVAFFLAEIGDKTQIVTVALAARFHELIPVVVGTTLGMMLANVPAVFLGHRYADRLPQKTLHRIAAIAFVVLAALALRTAIAA